MESQSWSLGVGGLGVGASAGVFELGFLSLGVLNRSLSLCLSFDQELPSS